MSFFKKLTETVTKGVSSATEKAQQTVEITRLYAQVNGKRREIEKLYQRIGESIYEAHRRNDPAGADQPVRALIGEIDALRREIASLEERIKELRNEKTCACGQVASYDAKFCPACGSRFPEPAVMVPEVVSGGEEEREEERKEERSSEEDEAAKPNGAAAATDEQLPVVCSGCGHPVEAGAAFCVNCGKPL